MLFVVQLDKVMENSIVSLENHIIELQNKLAVLSPRLADKKRFDDLRKLRLELYYDRGNEIRYYDGLTEMVGRIKQSAKQGFNKQ